MSLLDKFAAVEVKNDERISDGDRRFCEIHQEAYSASLQVFKDLRVLWGGVVEAQQEIFFGLPSEKRHSDTYLGAIKNLSVSEINEALEKTHSKFIREIVYYFNSTYTVSVESSEVTKRLLPKEPEERGWRRDEKQDREYHSEMQALELKYKDVLDQIFLLLGGRSFADRALDELKEKCHNAAWNMYSKKPVYEVKNDVIRLTGYACKFTDWYSSGQWELNDGAKAILRGIAHFETDSFHRLPHSFSDLVGWGRAKEPLISFSTCTKVVQLRMFKNNRVDIKFASALLAKQFSKDYLGLVC